MNLHHYKALAGLPSINIDAAKSISITLFISRLWQQCDILSLTRDTSHISLDRLAKNGLCFHFCFGLMEMEQKFSTFDSLNDLTPISFTHKSYEFVLIFPSSSLSGWILIKVSKRQRCTSIKVTIGIYVSLRDSLQYYHITRPFDVLWKVLYCIDWFM